MKTGLYDVLLGRYHDRTPISAVPEAGQRLQSVMSNLTRLFNTRQGSLDHLPDYGLPETTAIYQNAPYAIDGLRQAVKEVVQKYEPRLQRVYVELQGIETLDDMRVNFLISGQLDSGERVRFQTTFASDDLVHVRRWLRPE